MANNFTYYINVVKILEYTSTMEVAQRKACEIARDNNHVVRLEGYNDKMRRWDDLGRYYANGTFYDAFGIFRKLKRFGNRKKICNECKYNSGKFKQGNSGETLCWCYLHDDYFEAFSEKPDFCDSYEEK